MNKYKLINKQTGEEHLCDKVVIDGWDYYVSDELPQKNDKILCDERNHITENPKYKIRTCKSIVNDWIMTFEIDGPASVVNVKPSPPLSLDAWLLSGSLEMTR